MKHPEPDCVRWRAERAHLHHIDKHEMRARADWHPVSCPQCLGIVIPPFTSREPERTT